MYVPLPVPAAAPHERHRLAEHQDALRQLQGDESACVGVFLFVDRKVGVREVFVVFVCDTCMSVRWIGERAHHRPPRISIFPHHTRPKINKAGRTWAPYPSGGNKCDARAAHPQECPHPPPRDRRGGGRGRRRRTRGGGPPARPPGSTCGWLVS